MKKIMVFGTFDGLHKGHIFFLKSAKEKDSSLFVVVARDAFVKKIKNKNPFYTEKQRIQMVDNLDFVSKTSLADETMGTYSSILKEQPDIICLGHDQDALATNLAQWLKTNNLDKIKIKRINPFKRDIYSSTLLNKKREAN